MAKAGQKSSTGQKSSKPGLFDKKEQVTRREMRQFLRKDTGLIPGGRGRFRRQERVKLEGTLFDRRKYGQYITPRECDRLYRNLRGRRFRAKTEKERRDIDRRMRYLKRISSL